MIKAEYIRDPETVRRFQTEIEEAPVIAADTETEGFNPLTDALRLQQIATGPERCFIFDHAFIDPRHECFDFLRAKYADPTCVKIFQNGKFDMKFLMKHAGAD